jgi:hypothetical protein
MNTNNFKTLVEALEALPESIRNNEVNMGSVLEPKPICGTVGCFAGLISIVANDIPELKEFYKGNLYDYSKWEVALDSFLECSFRNWAQVNPNIWGNPQGRGVFSFPEAYGVEIGGALTHNMIIIYIRKAYDRWIAFENEYDEWVAGGRMVEHD